MGGRSSWIIQWFVCVLAGLGWLFPGTAQSYSPLTGHKPLTELALDFYESCFNDASYSPSQDKTRKRILLGNISMDHGMMNMPWVDRKLKNLIFSKLLRGVNWHFYNPDLNNKVKTKQGFIEKSHKRLWKSAKKRFSSSNDRSDKLLYLGGIIHHVEDVSVPAHVVPVYHGPTIISKPIIGEFKHLIDYMKKYMKDSGRDLGSMLKDPIDDMNVDRDALKIHINDRKPEFCKAVKAGLGEPDKIREDLARETLKLIEQEIPDCGGIRWKTFWNSPDPSEDPFFRKYNVKNGHPLFNETGSIPVPDGEPACTLKECEKRYRDFVFQTHLAAIRADLRLLRWANAKMSN